MADPLDLDAIAARYEDGGWEVFTADDGERLLRVNPRLSEDVAALVAEVRRLRAENAQLDAICWALNERTPTVVDAESGFRIGGRACEHPSLTGDRCDACGWTEAWEEDRG